MSKLLPKGIWHYNFVKKDTAISSFCWCSLSWKRVLFSLSKEFHKCLDFVSLTSGRDVPRVPPCERWSTSAREKGYTIVVALPLKNCQCLQVWGWRQRNSVLHGSPYLFGNIFGAYFSLSLLFFPGFPILPIICASSNVFSWGLETDKSWQKENIVAMICKAQICWLSLGIHLLKHLEWLFWKLVTFH